MSKRKRHVKLSQVFLKDKNIINKIINSLDIKDNELLVEIGGGEGAITFPMLIKGARLIVFEKDDMLRKRLLKSAVNMHFHDRICVLGDFLAFNFNDFSNLYGMERVKIVGNIPYHITGLILRKIIKEHSKLECAYFMMQKEVAKRLVSLPSTKEYAALSVLTQAFFDVSILFDIRPGSFYPEPKVTSSFVKICKKDKVGEIDEHFKEFEQIVKIAFSSRRKKLKNTLFKSIGPQDERYLDKRAEDLSVEDYIKILKSSIA